MNRWEAIEIFNRLRRDAIVVHGTGGMGIEVNTKSPSDLNLYSAMPYPTPVGLGLALALPKQRVVVTEGDGSALSGISSLATVANMRPQNLIQIVWDNGAWMSPGTMGTRQHYGPLPTASGGRTDLEGFARAAGFENTATVRTLEEFEAAARDAFAGPGPTYIVAKIGRKLMPDLPAKPLGTTEQAIRFRRGLIERGWISSGHAGVSQGKWLAPDDRSTPLVLPEIEAATEAGPHPSMEKARIVYSSLREAGIDFVVYLPDSANYFIQRLATADPQVTSVSVTREDEGLAIAMGAFMGGRNPALIIEASGLGLCTLAFAVLAHEQRMACLILYGHNFALGELRDVHACTRWVAEPNLDALRIPNLTLMDVKDAPLVIKQAWRTVRGQMCPVAVSLPLHVLWDE
jgi:thiamine pyrophosphate-dependent acetolactate synthase large subunit-like protein